MSRRPLIAGNWKMHLTVAQARQLAEDVCSFAADLSDRDVMIAPPALSTATVSEVLNNTSSAVILGAQNACWAAQGAFTGESSPVLLGEFGCQMVILGHSERRHVLGEDDVMINTRLLGVAEHGLVPVLCVGETLQEREGGKMMAVLEAQVRRGLKGYSCLDASKLVVAYEPVWAIGTGKTASKEQAQEAHAFIRGILADIYEKTIASELRILYGGSVNPDNIDSLMLQVDVDGALVGGAALQADLFNRIIHFR